MSNLESKGKNKILQIDYSDTNGIIKFISEKYKKKFNWEQYVNFYPDLDVKNLNAAWEHWTKYGLKEKRCFFLNDNIDKLSTSKPVSSTKNTVKFSKTEVKPIKGILREKKDKIITLKNLLINRTSHDNINFKIRLLRKNNLIYKNIYDNYGLHYYGWKEVINNFIKNFEKNTNFKQQFFFDEWIEKFLIWGDKTEMNFYLKEIYNNDYKVITFIHNPPFHQWYNADYKKNIRNKIIYNEEHTNKNLIKNLENYELDKQIVFFYTLSDYHKEYIYYKFPNLSNRVVSAFHPIEITGNEKCFDFSLFSSNRQIIHIGWWLRNFKTFIDFNQPKDFHKTILIKTDFENEWNNISTTYKLDNITIVKELSNTQYEKLFINCCLFIHLEDSCANNTILECIKFNTPVIVNKIPAVVEYLGENYPLYYQNNEELNLLSNPNYLLSLIKKANEYLVNMDKTNISLEVFNKKINYDLNKLDVNTNVQQLTWFCFIDDLADIDTKIIQLYNNFLSQNDNSKLILHVILCESLSNDEKYSLFLENIKKYSEIVLNIKITIQNLDKNYSNFLNYCSQICTTDYLVIVDIHDKCEKIYSSYCINYLNENINSDVIFTSYKITNNNGYFENFVFNKDAMIFNSNYTSIVMPDTGVIWRKDILSFVGEFISLSNKKNIFRDFWIRVLKNKFNIKCCNNEILYKSLVQ